jgi:hypothetical protein
LPIYSGYRDKINLTVEYTTFYDEVYLELAKSNSADNDSLQSKYDDFLKVIPISSIETAGLFDPKAYELFNSKSDSE